MSDTAMVRRKNKEGWRSDALIDEQLAEQLAGRAQAEGVDLLGPDGLLSWLTRAMPERTLVEEVTDRLGYEKPPSVVSQSHVRLRRREGDSFQSACTGQPCLIRILLPHILSRSGLLVSNGS